MLGPVPTRTSVPRRVLLVVLLAVGCGGAGKPSAGTPGDTRVGPSGGTVTSPEGVVLVVPANALSADTALSVVVSTAPAPAGAASPLFRFEPAGTTFTVPVTVSIPLSEPLTDAAIYWTTAANDGEYEILAATVADGKATAKVSHFSNSYVGPPNVACSYEQAAGVPLFCSELYTIGLSTADVAAYAQNCTAFAQRGCATANRVGVCTWSTNPPVNTTSVRFGVPMRSYYYAPYDPDVARADCTTELQGSFSRLP